MQREDPEVLIGTFHLFKVVSIVEFGAFVDCGFSKNLLVPLKEQRQKMYKGESFIVYTYQDERTGRLTGSTKIDKYIDEGQLHAAEYDEVDLLIYDETDIGFKAIINNTAGGLLYKEEVFQPLKYGQHIKGFVKKIREDGKIDLILQKPGHENIDDVSQKILKHLESNSGFSAISDKTPPEEIYRLFQISKKKFKIACGHLYKQRLITIEDKGMRLKHA